MIKVKNVQSGILIIADAGIKLGPGETADMDSITIQAANAIDNGLLTRVDIDPEPKQRSRATAKADEQTVSNKQLSELKLESEPVKTDPGVKNGAG